MKNVPKIPALIFIINMIIHGILVGGVLFILASHYNRDLRPAVIIISLAVSAVISWIHLTAERNHNWDLPNRNMAYAYLISSIFEWLFALTVIIISDVYTVIQMIQNPDNARYSLPVLIISFILARLIPTALFVFILIASKNQMFNTNLLFHHFIMGNTLEFADWCSKLLLKQKSPKKRFAVVNSIQFCLGAHGRYNESVELLESFSPAALSSLSKAVYYNNLVYALLMLDRIDEASAIYNQNALVFANKPDVVHTLGLLNYKTGHYYDAVQQFRKVIELKSSRRCLFSAEIDLTKTLIALKDFAGAEAELKKAEELSFTPYDEVRLNETRNELKEAIPAY